MSSWSLAETVAAGLDAEAQWAGPSSLPRDGASSGVECADFRLDETQPEPTNGNGHHSAHEVVSGGTSADRIARVRTSLLNSEPRVIEHPIDPDVASLMHAARVLFRRLEKGGREREKPVLAPALGASATTDRVILVDYISSTDQAGTNPFSSEVATKYVTALRAYNQAE